MFIHFWLIYIHSFSLWFHGDLPQLETHWTFPRSRPSDARRRVLAQLLLTEEPKLQRLRWHRQQLVDEGQFNANLFKRRMYDVYNIYIYMFSWNTVHPGFLKLPPHFIGNFERGRFIILTQEIDWLLLPIWNRQGCTNNHWNYKYNVI